MSMGSSLLAPLETAHEKLIEALDANDVDAIERQVEKLRLAIAQVRAHGAWHEGNDLKDCARRIVQLGEAARQRVNFLTDINRQRLHLLSAARGEPHLTVYSQSGRSAA
jgi:hypothetical protein